MDSTQPAHQTRRVSRDEQRICVRFQNFGKTVKQLRESVWMARDAVARDQVENQLFRAAVAGLLVDCPSWRCFAFINNACIYAGIPTCTMGDPFTPEVKQRLQCLNRAALIPLFYQPAGFESAWNLQRAKSQWASQKVYSQRGVIEFVCPTICDILNDHVCEASKAHVMRFVDALKAREEISVYLQWYLEENHLDDRIPDDAGTWPSTWLPTSHDGQGTPPQPHFPDRIEKPVEGEPRDIRWKGQHRFYATESVIKSTDPIRIIVVNTNLQQDVGDCSARPEALLVVTEVWNDLHEEMVGSGNHHRYHTACHALGEYRITIDGLVQVHLNPPDQPGQPNQTDTSRHPAFAVRPYSSGRPASTSQPVQYRQPNASAGPSRIAFNWPGGQPAVARQPVQSHQPNVSVGPSSMPFNRPGGQPAVASHPGLPGKSRRSKRKDKIERVRQHGETRKPSPLGQSSALATESNWSPSPQPGPSSQLSPPVQPGQPLQQSSPHANLNSIANSFVPGQPAPAPAAGSSTPRANHASPKHPHAESPSRKKEDGPGSGASTPRANTP